MYYEYYSINVCMGVLILLSESERERERGVNRKVVWIETLQGSGSACHSLTPGSAPRPVAICPHMQWCCIPNTLATIATLYYTNTF